MGGGASCWPDCAQTAHELAASSKAQAESFQWVIFIGDPCTLSGSFCERRVPACLDFVQKDRRGMRRRVDCRRAGEANLGAGWVRVGLCLCGGWR